jgi:hypothetical protein
VKVKLKDGTIAEIHIDPSWDDEAKQRAIREYKAGASADPSDTDELGTYAGKEAKSIVRGSGAGGASLLDTLSNTLAVAPRMLYNKWNGDPLLTGFNGTTVRDAYEENVFEQPRGSDYETSAKVAETVAPAVVETLLTGSPKTAPLRAARDVATGYLGGEAGEYIGDKYSPEAGDLGRVLGSAVAPYAVTRTAVRALPVTGAVSRLANRFGLPDPTNLIPPTNKFSAVGGVGAGVDYRGDENDMAAAEREAERYRRMRGLQ